MTCLFMWWSDYPSAVPVKFSGSFSHFSCLINWCAAGWKLNMNEQIWEQYQSFNSLNNMTSSISQNADLFLLNVVKFGLSSVCYLVY